MLVYLLKASLVLGVVYAVYWLLFRRDTFHQTKRFVLLAGLVFSVVLPLLQLDVWQTPVSIEPTQAASVPLEYWLLLQQMQPLEETTVSATEIGLLAYVSICVLMALWLMFRLFKLLRFLQTAQYRTTEGYTVALHPQVKTPFSFFSRMLLPAELPDDTLRRQIIAHEAAHIRQWHTADILLMELYLVFFWFNPVAWLYRQQMRLNLEFLADNAVLQTGADSTAYQINLLKISASPTHLSLANHFRFSSLKNRILMMNRPHSSAYARLKYAVLPVLLTGLVAAFHLTQAETTLSETIIENTSILQSFSVKNAQNAIDASSKTRIIKGTVRDVDSRQPIADVRVTVRGGQEQAVVTGSDGRFSIPVSDSDKLLLFEHSSYLTPQLMQITAETPDEFTIWLKTKSAQMPSAIVSDEKVMLRSIGVPPPLYILDGNKMTESDMRQLNPNDIENITVLKDQSAIDVYGDEGKNGAVIITTKQQNNLFKGLQNIQIHTMLFILNGQKVNYEKTQSLDPKNIASISVLKDKAATDAYGEEGKNGVITISTKEAGNLPIAPEKQVPITNPPPLYLVDGKEIPAEKVKELKPEDIEDVSVMIDKTEVEKKYGKKGKNGVVLIRLKKK